MEFSIKSGSPEKQRSACVVVGVFESRKLTLPAELLDKAAGGYISDIVRRGDMEGKAATTLLLHNVPGTLCDRVLLVGLGKEKEFHEKEFLGAICLAVKTVNETGAFDASLFLSELPVRQRGVAWRVRQTAMIALEATYRFDRFKSKKDEVRRPLRKLTLAVERRNEHGQAEQGLAQGIAIAGGMAAARDLGNLPANICNPAHVAEQARAMAREFNLECEVLERADMEKLGMRSLLPVAALLGTLGHYCLTRSYRNADISATQSLKFLDLVWASMLGFIVFADVPTVSTLIGGAVISAATLWLARRESRALSLMDNEP